MRKFLATSFAASVLLFGSALAAHAAAIAQLACTSTTGTAADAALSYYDLGASQPTNPGIKTEGVGAGKITYSPLQIHAALSQFGSFYPVFLSGGHFSTCVLTSSVGGTTFKVAFKDVFISSVNAIASNNTAAAGGSPAAFAYVEVNLAYAAIQVEANGANDGGISPGGWNRVKNISDGSGTTVVQ